MSDWRDTRQRVTLIQAALKDAIKSRSACDVENRDGIWFARFYWHGPDDYGALAAELNLEAIAADIERALS